MLHVRVCEGRTRRIDEGHMSVEMKSDKDSKEYVQERTESNEETMKSRQRK